MNAKMVIVMRKDLNMRKGKMMAQAAHAACTFLIEKLNRLSGPTRICTNHPWTAVEKAWLEGGQTKISVSVNSEEELLQIYEKCKDAGVTVHLITDAGRTEFKNPTMTCLAVGPDAIDKINGITGHLPLL